MVDLIVNWLVAAVALFIVAKVISGFEIRGFGEALVAAAVIAIVDVTLGPVLRFISFPITLLTLGLFRFVIYAVVLKVAALFSPGFRISGFIPALVGAVVLTILRSILRYVVSY